MPENAYENYLQMKLDSVFEVETPRKLEIVEKNGRYNYKDENGNLLRENWVWEIYPFHDGLSRIRECYGPYKYIYENGEELWYINDIGDEVNEFSSATDFENGRAVVLDVNFFDFSNPGHYCVIDTNGHILSNIFDKYSERVDGFATVSEYILDPKTQVGYIKVKDYVDINGKKILDNTRTDIVDIEQIANGYVLITRDNYFFNTFAIFHLRNQLTPWKTTKPDIRRFSKQFFEINGKVVSSDIDFGGYNVNRYAKVKKGQLVLKQIDDSKYYIEMSLFRCSNGEDTFYTKDKPIKIYGNGIALCNYEVAVILHNEKDQSEKVIGSVEAITYDDHFIYDSFHHQVFFVYNGEIYDVTKYYEKYLKGKKYSIKDFNVAIMTQEEFNFREKVKQESKDESSRVSLSEIAKSDSLYRDYVLEKLNAIFGIKKPGRYRVVNINGRNRYVDENDQVMDDIDDAEIWPFHDGLSRYKVGKVYYFVREDGETPRLFYGPFDYARDFKDGRAIVGYNNSYWDGERMRACIDYFAIDTDGKEITSKMSWANMSDFNDGYALVSMRVMRLKKNQESQRKPLFLAGYIDENGKKIIYNWFKNVKLIANGYALVTKNGKVSDSYAVFDNKGHRITRWSKKMPKIKVFTRQFIEINGKNIFTDIDYGDYEIETTQYGYRCTSDNDSFTTKKNVIKIYGNGIALVESDSVFYLHNADKTENKIEEAYFVEYNDNLIIDHFSNCAYLIYGGHVHDITEYYREYLIGKDYYIRDFDVDLKTRFELSRTDFDKEFLTKRKVEEKPKESRKETKKEPEKKEVIDNPADSLNKLVVNLEKYEGIREPKKRTKVNDLFIPKDDHLQINPIYLEMSKLKTIDLEGVSFADVEISGIDFRGCNITFGENGLNPQEVWEKDLTCCNFEGIHIKPDVDFTGVDIRGARFGRDNDPDTDDRGSDTFQEAIYDGSTTFDGISFFIIYGECQNRKGSAKK